MINKKIMHRLSLTLLTALALVFASGASPAQATDGFSQESESDLEWAKLIGACEASVVHMRVNPLSGVVEFGYIVNSVMVYYTTDTFAVGLNHLSEVRLKVLLVGGEGVFEVSPEGGATELIPTHNGRANITITPDSSGGDREFLIAVLDQDGQEMPSVPTITVKTKKSCPLAPVDDLDGP